MSNIKIETAEKLYVKFVNTKSRDVKFSYFKFIIIDIMRLINENDFTFTFEKKFISKQEAVEFITFIKHDQNKIDSCLGQIFNK